MPPQCHHRSRSPSWLQHVQHFWDQIGLSSPTLLVQFSQKRGTYFWERAQGQVSLCISAARRRKASLLSSRPLQRPGRLPETLRFATRHSGHSCRLTRLKIHSHSFNRLHPFNPFQIISNASEQQYDLRCDMRTQCSKQHRGTPATDNRKSSIFHCVYMIYMYDIFQIIKRWRFVDMYQKGSLWTCRSSANTSGTSFVKSPCR